VISISLAVSQLKVLHSQIMISTQKRLQNCALRYVQIPTSDDVNRPHTWCQDLPWSERGWAHGAGMAHK